MARLRKLPRSRSFPADRRAWLVVGFLSVVVVGLAIARRPQRIPVEPPDPGDLTRDFRLVVLAYPRVLDRSDGNHVTSRQLEAHLEAARKRGFEAVTLAQLEAAYYDGGKLPPRSLLLTFDGGYLSTYRLVHPVLRRLRWPALMFLETSRQEARDTTFLYWDRLRSMLDSGLWALGTHGHRSIASADREDIPGDPIRSRDLVTRALAPIEIRAFAPLRGVSKELARSPVSVQEAFLFGFEDGALGLNDASADPRRLRRLPVHPSSNPDSLGDHLRAAVTSPPLSLDEAETAATLVPGSGTVTWNGPVLDLRGSVGADVWLAGSRWAEGWELLARIRPESGQFWVAQQNMTGDRQWRWGGDRSGLCLQERINGEPPSRLSGLAHWGKSADWHTVRLVKRGRGLWVEFDGAPVAQAPLPLPWSDPGDVGIVAASDRAAAHLRVTDVRLRRLPYRLQFTSSDPSAAEVEDLARQAVELAALSPLWLRQRGGEIEEQQFNRDLFAILQSRYAWQILPEVELSGPQPPPDESWVQTAAVRAANAGWDGLHLDVGGLDPAGRQAARTQLESLDRALRARGLALVVTGETVTGQGASSS